MGRLRRNANIFAAERGVSSGRKPDVFTPSWVADGKGADGQKAQLPIDDRLPRVKGPRAPGNHGPGYMHDWADRLAQVEDPEILKEHQAEQNRDRSQPSALEIQHMEQCNEFLRAFRDQDALGAQVLARWAMASAFGQSVAKKAQAMGIAKSSFYARRESGLKACATMLNRRGIGVF